MKESKILYFNISALQAPQATGTYTRFRDYPEAERVIDEYLAQGWSISEFSAKDALCFFVVLTS